MKFKVPELAAKISLSTFFIFLKPAFGKPKVTALISGVFFLGIAFTSTSNLPDNSCFFSAISFNS